VKKLTAVLLTLIGLLQYRLWFGDGNVLELHRLGDHIEELRREGAKRRERNAALEAEVMDLKQGTDAIEERARQDLGMVKEGELFVQIIEHKDTAHPEPAAAEENRKPERDTAKRRHPRRETAKPTPPADTQLPTEAQIPTPP
jgi:cell division protein FtsB